MQLTEQMILSRCRERNLSSIQKLNIWGYDLTDVSVLERLPNLKVVVLSENQINSLKQFQHCYNLQELYLHSNDIQDIDELIYLKNLPLKRLVLANNPCCRNSGDSYRVNVIKMLPFLECLDNQNVTRCELDTAMNLRVLQRNSEAQNASQQSMGSVNPNQHSQQGTEIGQLYVENTPLFTENQRFGQQSRQNLKLKPLYSQIGLEPHSNANRQFAREDISLSESQPYKTKINRYANYYSSQMDLSEWKKQNQAQESNFSLRTLSPNSRPGFLTERPTYRLHDELTSDYGYVSPSSNIPHFVPTIPADEVSVNSSRTSSVASSNQGKMSYPRSRRVNLLCASLRFVLELDALSLVDVLSTIRGRIEELRSV